jgi:hypothetical protein
MPNLSDACELGALRKRAHAVPHIAGERMAAYIGDGADRWQEDRFSRPGHDASLTEVIPKVADDTDFAAVLQSGHSAEPQSCQEGNRMNLAILDSRVIVRTI